MLVSSCLQFDLIHRLVGSSAKVYYVSPSGSNWNFGLSEKGSFRTIGRAASLLRPGDQIVLLPGEYQERVHLKRGGTASSPVVLEALKPGTATITWSRPLSEVATQWTDVGDGIFACHVSTPVYQIREGNRTLFRQRFGNDQGLRALIRRPNAFPAFCQFGGRLFLFLNGRHPNQVELLTHRTVPEPREWGEMKSANLWVETDHVEITGIQFEFGIGSAIRIWNGKNTRISHCTFKGCGQGISDRHGLSVAGQLAIDHCLYDNFPQFEWSKQWLDWDNLYAHYSTSGLVSSSARNLTVTHNAVLHCADGMAISPDITSRAKIERNWISGVTDDGIELDGSACNVDISMNFIENCHCSLGLSPVRVGPVEIQHNYMINDPAGYNAVFKLLSPWEDATGEVVGIQNIMIQENIGIGRDLVYWNPRVPVSKINVKHNVWQLTNADINWPPMVKEEGNVLIEAAEEISDFISQETHPPHLNTSSSSIFAEVLALPAECGPVWWSRKNDHAAKTTSVHSSQKAKRP